MLLLHHDQHWKRVVLPRGLAPRASAFGERRADSCTSGAMKDGGTPGTRTPDTLTGAAVFKTVSSTGRTRSFRLDNWCSREDLHLELPPSQDGVQDSYTSGADEKVVAASGIAPDSSPLQGDANLSQLHSHVGSPAWTRTTTTRLTAGHAALTSLGSLEKWSLRAVSRRGLSVINRWLCF